MVELIHFLNRDNWNVIERGRIFDAVSYYNTDTRRPLTFLFRIKPSRMANQSRASSSRALEISNLYERYISLAQITSIHKGSHLRNVYETISEERLSLVGSHLNYILDLGLMEPEEAEQVIEETGTE